MDINTAQAVLARRVMREHLEFVSVVPIQTILSSEPHESLIVLYDLSNLGLGEPLSGRQSGESDIVAIDCWNSHGACDATLHFSGNRLWSRRIESLSRRKGCRWDDEQ